MKIKSFIIILFLLSPFKTYSQISWWFGLDNLYDVIAAPFVDTKIIDKKINVKGVDWSGGNVEFEARDAIHFQPGFHYKPDPGKRLHAHLAETMILPVDYITLPSSDGGATVNKPINTNLPVGVIAGAPGTTSSGAYTYTIPIFTPPGTAGMTPSISLNYNSQSGNGILGMGWGIGGLSAITRMPKTIYHDGKVEWVSFEQDCPLALDGNRLIAINGSYGADGTIYHTEIETFNKIKSIGVVGTSPDKFEVNTKDGKTMYYGSEDSKFFDENVNNVIFWRLKGVRDNYGNYIEYRYENSGREPRIAEILYTGNDLTGFQPYCKINFFYEERTDKNSVFLLGSKLNSNLVLRRITVKVDENLYKSYDLKYFFDAINQVSQLAEIIESGSDGTSLNSTVFSYENFPVTPTSNTISIIAGINIYDALNYDDYTLLDYNGDGKQDIYVFKNYTWQLYTNMGNNTFECKVCSPLNLPAGYSPYNDFYPLNSTGVGNMMFNKSDFNGDGNDDLLLIAIEHGAGTSAKLTYYLINLSDPTISHKLFQETIDNYLDGEYIIRYLDMDGDKRMDLFISSNQNKIKIINEIEFKVNTINSKLVEHDLADKYDFKSSYPVEFNGDGVAELTGIKKPGADYNSKKYFCYSSVPLINKI